MKIQQNQKKKVYFFKPLEKEILVENMQKVVDANEKLVNELKDGKNIMLVSRQG